MQLELTKDQEMFRRTVRQFLERESPLTKVRELADEPAGFDRAWWRQGAEMGWTAMLVPEELGGGTLSGQGLLDLALVAEEMGRLVSPGALVPVNVVIASIVDAGVGGHGKALEALMAGEAIAAWYDGSGVTASPAGGGYTLDGTAELVEAGADADHLLVTARTGDGLRQFLLPATAPGLTPTRRDSLDLVRRHADIGLDEVRADVDTLVGGDRDAAAAVDRQRQIATVLQTAETAGAIDRVFEFTTQWAFDRYSFGRPLASYQALKHRFADMKMWLEASHATVTAAARAVQERSPHAAELASVAKAYVGDRAAALVQDCVQMHGGIGVTWEHDIHLYLRRVTVNQLTYGTPSDHRRRVADLLAA
ncbi:acyl-CoA dehydrogenase family protein [Phytohabitans sp. ZYX-F-186]|uniref:Acyl-CoA dehydrogenase family protein n=1 Tax=Phytohabitans maris TaxID=3071409 RepID=A0ABU0ZXV0_9ACTN|nr:acyl-CoA dehydrogenase family protein [Phytohabitans sp. ZYX-F-186]MDQ7910807.1 acyl-CoA dehydrogenase family protein [Phytohabitans sp. ZYX-F-186]